MLGLILISGVALLADAPQPTPRPPSFMVLDFAGDGIALTTAAEGVTVTIEPKGPPAKVGWTRKGSDDAFLVHDGNGNRIVDAGEFVGSTMALTIDSRPVSGATVLALHLQGITIDDAGRPVGALPENAGMLNKADKGYGQLLVWTDVNHDGRSQPSELKDLADAGVLEIRTGFRRKSGKDEAGNTPLFEGTWLLEQKGAPATRTILEVVPAR